MAKVLRSELQEGASYKWNTGSTSNKIVVYSEGTYKVDITKNGCTLSRDVKIGKKDLDFSIRKDIFYVEEGETVRLDAYGGDIYRWNGGQPAASSMITEPIMADSKMLVSIEDLGGCKKDFWFYFRVKDKLDNIVTPDGDGENDVWVLPDKYRSRDVKVNIYNRLGLQVYEKLDYDNGWSGKGLPAGVYFYVIQFRDGYLLKGSLNIVK